MPKLGINSVKVVRDANAIAIVETQPMAIGDRVAIDTTTISLSLDQAVCLKRLLCEAIAAASDGVFDSRQTALWSKTALRAVAIGHSRRLS